MDASEPDHAASSMGQQQQNAPQYSHAGHGQQSLGHSVVPDLMKIYESLTQSKTPQTQQHAVPQLQQPTQPHQQMSYANASHFFPPAPAAAPFPYQPQQFVFPTQQLPDTPVPHFASTDNHEAQQVPSSGRTLRKRSVDKVEDDRSNDESTSRSRKKKKSDGRWSKRFTWPDELHRDFVSAIFDIGLKNASPSALIEHMPAHDQLTSERLKSHLQKYRINRAKSKKEFMSCYDASLGNYQATGIKTKSLGSGEVAAHLAYATMNEPEETEPQAQMPEAHSNTTAEATHDMPSPMRGGALVLPKLTEAEKQSPIGASMGYMVGLFFALRQQLMANRAAAAAASGNAEVVDAPNGNVPFVSYPNSTDAEHLENDGGQIAAHDPMGAAWPPGTAMEPQHVSYQDQVNAHAAAASNAQASASRSNLEESNLMKREMQNQMAFQNKMRALKQQELNKTKTTGKELNQNDEIGDGHADTSDDQGRIKDDGEQETAVGNEKDEGAFNETGDASDGQAPGSGRARQHGHGLSMGAAEDFWVNDEQLFEFLMNT